MITLMDPNIEEYVKAKSERTNPLLNELMDETYKSIEMPQMVTGQIEGRLLKLLVQISGAKRILEIGMFTGYSALSMAESLPADGELITTDVNPKVIAFAKRYFGLSEHGKKIKVMEGPALESIKQLKGSFDFVFIDADKENYSNYYDAVLPLLKSGGLILVDNVLWGGRVLSPEDETDKAIDQFNCKVANDNRVEKVMLTVRDGLYLIRKK